MSTVYFEAKQIRDLEIITRHINAMNLELEAVHRSDINVDIFGDGKKVEWGDGHWLDFDVIIKDDLGDVKGQIELEETWVRFVETTDPAPCSHDAGGTA